MGASPGTLMGIRGNRISMVFQEPMTSLNPVFTIGMQVMEVIHAHETVSKEEAFTRAVNILTEVGIADAAARMSQYPHHLSGGQRQRVMIAMALVLNPSLLIADEPTTALDVTIQAQILDLMKDLQKELGMALLMITHDLGVARLLSHRIMVMKSGEVIETGLTDQVLDDPREAYTQLLVASILPP